MAQYERYLIKRSFKMKHDIDLTRQQLDLIEDIYFESRKTNIVNVGIYRLINATIGIFGVLLFFFTRNTPIQKWFFVGFAVLFVIYNVIHCFNNYVDYKRLRKPNKVNNESK